MNYIIDPFDSKIFSSKVAKFYVEKDSITELKKLYQHIEEDQIKICAVFTKFFPRIINTLQENMFKLVGTQCELVLKIKEIKQVNILRKTRIMNTGKFNNLLPIVKLISNHSRWSKDINVPDTKVKEYYKNWLINSINGYADKIITYLENEEIIGMLSFKILKDKSIKIDLIGVLSNYQAKGIGTTMLNELIRYCKRNNIGKIKVITEFENITALKFYIKNKFKIFDYNLVFHKHISYES